MSKSDIPPEIKQLLMIAAEGVLTRTIWGLSSEQKNTPLFRDIGLQRYLSALRTGGIDEAEMTKTAFKMDPYFLKSQLVMDAATQGFLFQVAQGHLAVATKIKMLMGLGDDCVVPPEATVSADEPAPIQ